MVMVVVILLYQRFGAIFMSKYQFEQSICLNDQALAAIMLLGKLSKLIIVNFPKFAFIITR